MGLFERWLSLWVGLAIVTGILLGNVAPGLFNLIAELEVASVNLVVAVLIWAMIFPMMVAVDFGSLRDIGGKPKGLIITLVVNWLIKPFTMASLPWDTSVAILSASITGPWAYGVAIIALATAFSTLAFNNDLSGAGKTLVFLTIAIAGLVLVTTLVTALFGGAASTSSITTMQMKAIVVLLSIATLAATVQYYIWMKIGSSKTTVLTSATSSLSQTV